VLRPAFSTSGDRPAHSQRPTARERPSTPTRRSRRASSCAGPGRPWTRSWIMWP